MTAPDRIWLQFHPGLGDVVDWAFCDGTSCDTEYIRKGAFPVEEIRDSTMFQLGAASEEDWCKETHKLYRLLTRILSLLEDSE